MATINDVAKIAGVSKSLVSRYLNGQKGVSEASAKNIDMAIKQLDYRPNGIARSLVLQKTHSIGIVLDTICESFVAPLLKGIEQGAEDFDTNNEYSILYCASNGDLQKKQRNVDYLTQGRCDGILIYGSLITDDTIIQSLAKQQFPFLLVENKADGIAANKVLIDNFDGAVRATNYLINLGHKKIAYVAGDPNILITRDREKGFLSAMNDNGLIVNPNYIIRPDYTKKYKKANPVRPIRGDYSYYMRGYYCMQKFLQQNKNDLPTAIFFSSDILAFGAILAFKEVGISVPEDVSIIGFDSEMPEDFDCDEKPITSMQQPSFDAGYNGIRILLQELKKPCNETNTLTLKTRFIDNKTCRSL